jgi:thiamine-monophosphate kinase
MANGEQDFVRWLRSGVGHPQPWTRLGIGDDMAILRVGNADILITTDMLLDGVHFSTADHDLESIGRKALACSLSDCAAMACQPLAATASVALSRSMGMKEAGQLVTGMRRLADEFECDLVGGDTTRWDRPLCLDVCMLGTPWPGIEPVRRSGARTGDRLFVTGPLGGSLLGRHLSFTPRVREARQIAQTLGDALHAMMDISDGVALDLSRLCESSAVGATLIQSELEAAIHDNARAAARDDGRSPLDHALHDGEDFELLLAVSAETADDDLVAAHNLLPIGHVTEGRTLHVETAGARQPLEPRGYDHLHDADPDNH